MLPSSGMISLDNVNVELGRTSGSMISLGDSAVRILANKLEGPISMHDLHGKSHIETFVDKESFMRVRDSWLKKFNNDLRDVTLEFTSETAIDFSGLFKGTSITSTPKKIIIAQGKRNQIILSELFYGLTTLRDISPELFKHIEVDFIGDAMFKSTYIRSIPEGLFNFTKIVSAIQCFSECPELITVPVDILSRASSLRGLQGLFKNSVQVETAIEFPNLCKATDISEMYYNTGIREVPEGMFYNFPRITANKHCFGNCRKLRMVLGTLYNMNRTSRYDIEEFGGEFEGCTALESVADNIYGDPTCFYTIGTLRGFKGCVNLTTCPTMLFSKEVKVRNILDIFNGCTKMTLGKLEFNRFEKVETILNAYKDCTSLLDAPGFWLSKEKLNDVSGCFDGCSNYTGAITELWTGMSMFIPKKHEYYARGCFNASNYISIPSDWK